MKALALATAALVAAATLTTPAHATSTASQVRALRSGIRWERSRAWHWQTVAGLPRSPTIRGAGLSTHSPGYLRWIEKRWQRRRLRAYRVATRPPQPVSRVAGGGSVATVICSVFGAACSQALTVARCESGLSIHAVNGQYLGLFQMGSAERARFATAGYATAYEQTVAAHNYYAVSGWGPWSCRP